MRTQNFNPRSPRGLRLSAVQVPAQHQDFNPRSPRGLRLSTEQAQLDPLEFQSTQPKRAATLDVKVIFPLVAISIHAAQEGCDPTAKPPATLPIYFNPRSPRGLRHPATAVYSRSTLFQSTQPKRAATSKRIRRRKSCGISIHAAQEGCDKEELFAKVRDGNFNPRSPRGLRLFDENYFKAMFGISIHAAQEGCDGLYSITCTASRRFQSTQPKRAATA